MHVCMYNLMHLIMKILCDHLLFSSKNSLALFQLINPTFPIV